MADSRTTTDLTTVAVQTLKMLAVDAVEAANSGHPGSPMGQADIAYVLWTKYLCFWPADPAWPNRDRFVLSAGHGSMLLYGLLHLTGYDLPLDELKRFRQWGSMTPGHPEYGHAPGVETTTGPLGQGFGNAVGMAIASRMAAARYNSREFRIVDHRVFAVCSDGDVMEGVCHEAASIAGHLGLGNLILVYDDNHITIEGDTALAFSEDVPGRFEAYGWHVQKIDGHDHAAIEAALATAVAETARPSLICARTHIANGAPHAHDTAEAHGAPLGPEEVKATKEAAGWPLEPTFYIPDEARQHWRDAARRNKPAYDGWQETFARWRAAEPGKAVAWDRARGGAKELPADLEERLIAAVGDKVDATRGLGSIVLQEAARLVPSLVGGSADLDPSTKTAIKGSSSVARGAFDGRVFHFGIREHGMGAILNGMALYGGFVPFGSTFLIFSDYMRPAIRLAALMKQRVTYVFTHDSVLLGEDGPTHQPVEQLWALRLIPGIEVWRPADGAEVAVAWARALRRADGPTAIVLTRQKVAAIPRRPRPGSTATGATASPAGVDAAAIARGGHVVVEADAPAGRSRDALTLVATGSEVGLAVEAAKLLVAAGHAVRVVSMPCIEAFLAQDAAWRDLVLPPAGRRVALELGRGLPWAAVVGVDALVIGLDRFGASAPAGEIARQLGFTAEGIAARIRNWADGSTSGAPA